MFPFIFTLWLFNIAMENDTFTDDFPIKTSIYNGFSIAMLHNQMVPLFQRLIRVSADLPKGANT